VFILYFFRCVVGAYANAFKAAGEAFSCFLARGSWYTDTQLCIVFIRVTDETELRHNVKQFRHVQQEQHAVAVGLKQTLVVLKRVTEVLLISTAC